MTARVRWKIRDEYSWNAHLGETELAVRYHPESDELHSYYEAIVWDDDGTRWMAECSTERAAKRAAVKLARALGKDRGK